MRRLKQPKNNIQYFNIQYLISFLFRKRFWLLFLAGVGILVDIFLLKFTFDLIILLLAGLWVLTIWLFKFEGRVSAGGALGFLILCPILLIFKKDFIAEKAAIWAYVFLVIGVGQMFVEYLQEERKRKN